MREKSKALGLVLLLGGAWAPGLSAAVITGAIHDASGAAVPNSRITLTDCVRQAELKTASDTQGVYSYTAVPAARYDLRIEAAGFETQLRRHLEVQSDSELRLDAVLQVSQRKDAVTVVESSAEAEIQAETAATHLGGVLSDKEMQALPLNGRGYTDLLAVQPGVSATTTLTPTSVIMAGVTGTIHPSGDLNAGDVSISGQRESANGFMLNSVDVQEHMNGGTSIIPNLDSIQQLRVLTNNFDAEYGNYNGGMIEVVTKSGGNAVHGDVFEFLRNTALDARNFFDETRGVFRQNQFGGVMGGSIKKDRIFFFVDYQGTRTVEGIALPATTVPSVADRAGNLGDVAGMLTGTVSGAYTAQMLQQKLGYGVTQGEPYYARNCTSTLNCVFPNAVIPARAWSSPAVHLLKYIPLPNVGADQFATSAYNETVRDDKGGARLDASTRFGALSGYYFVDNYRLDNPYPGGQGGASIPGFDALTIGQAQMLAVGDVKVLSVTAVNEAHIGLVRNANNVGQPHGGLGVTLQSQGFVTGAGTPGIVVQAPQFEGVENIVFPSFVMGVPVTNVKQWNNTIYLSDALSKVAGRHTLKFGGEFHYDQVNEHPNATFNGTFNIDGTATGSAFADFLLGMPSNFTQSSGQNFYLRNRYAAAFAEDSWRARDNLTVNFGVRWDLIMPWWEKYNQIQTLVPGEQSVLYPNAVPGLVVPGDPGIPSTLARSSLHNFAPRMGLAYAPDFRDGFFKMLLGGRGKSSVRASYGMFYTAFPGLSAGIMYGVPPYGYTYLSPGPPLLAAPFVNSSNGAQSSDPFPLNFPPHNVSATNPFTGFNFGAATPVSGDPYFYSQNSVPYTENYMLSLQRQFGSATLLTVSYAGNEGHHLLVLTPQNPGNAALCLSLSQPGRVAAGSATCGPFGEDAVYTSAAGKVYQGTRAGLGSNFGPVTAQKSAGNAAYDALEVNLRVSAGTRATLQVGYTYAKSIDGASNLGEQTNPFDSSLTRVISSWDMTHNFVATYSYALPFEKLMGRRRWSEGWTLAGTTRLTTGFPVTISDDSDRSLMGTLGNGVNNQLLDTPQMTAGPLEINTNPRNGRTEFRIDLFSPETLGQLGNAARRSFYGPGIENFDMELSKTVTVGEAKAFDIRIEAFNVFNHAQFYGASAVDGQINDANFGRVVSAAAPRLLQAAVKFHF